MIEKESPHLASILKREFGNISRMLQDSFDFSLTHGGALELGFSRPEGQSFNPRLARIPIIAFQAIKTISEKDMANLIISPTLNIDLNKNLETIANCSLINTDCLKEVDEILNYVKFTYIINEVSDFEKTKLNNISIIAASSLFIDRIRHAHQVGTIEVNNCLSEVSFYNELANDVVPSFCGIINSWSNKFSRLKS